MGIQAKTRDGAPSLPKETARGLDDVSKRTPQPVVGPEGATHARNLEIVWSQGASQLQAIH